MMDRIEQLANWASALKAEHQHEQEWSQSWLSQTSPQQRREKGMSWYPIKVVEDGYGLGAYPYLFVENPRPQKGHAFQSGNPVSLFSQADASFGERLVGNIGFVDDQRMKIIFQCDELPDWVDNGKLGVDVLFDEKSFKEMFYSLNLFINLEKGRLLELRESLFGNRKQAIDELYQKPKGLKLNDSQLNAVYGIVSQQDVAVVHGPPGTGKTTTLVAAVGELTKQGKKVLLTAPSNAATDHLLQQCIRAGMKGLRIGNVAKVEEDNQALTIDALLARDPDFKRIRELKKRAIEFKKMGAKYKRSFGKEEADQRRLLFQEARNLQKEARDWEQYLIEKHIDESQVVAATLIGANHSLIKERKWDVVVIDEAGQALAPACFVAIAHADKVILAGDPHQLPPTVKSHHISVKPLHTTLLDVVVKNNPEAVFFLDTQYRMNERIMHYSNVHFYQERLNAHETVKDQCWHEGQPPVVFLDTAGCGFEEQKGDEGESLQNEEEIKLIVQHLERWSVHHAHEVAVISPYRAQVTRMQEALKDIINVEVNTIDSFQGQESDVVYISLVRSNAEGEIGFLKDYRRMNVAMTRARKGLIVIGDSATLANDSFYGKWMDWVESEGGYASAWEYMA
jgi:superfamily I DNA and/or RNA helicase